jgi:hypothetical protein
MTKRGAGNTIDGTSMQSLKALQDSVVDFGATSFGPSSKSIYISFSLHTRMQNEDRPPQQRREEEGFPASHQNKIVQEVIRTILEAIAPKGCSTKKGDLDFSSISNRPKHNLVVQYGT